MLIVLISRPLENIGGFLALYAESVFEILFFYIIFLIFQKYGSQIWHNYTTTAVWSLPSWAMAVGGATVSNYCGVWRL
jgi:hypothetical protein